MEDLLTSYFICVLLAGYLTLAKDFSAGKGSNMNFKSVNEDHPCFFPGLQAFTVRVME
jgi:hypothetical protein